MSAISLICRSRLTGLHVLRYSSSSGCVRCGISSPYEL